ncbi:TetR/AcrR family transcriptional regulator [Pararobbsia silviterrae]|uniref:TetR/AcrR family transcriptional regulator n=1 Tax=Pararobbsia silviterrae TaxID=1792498 RepID=A0A494X651_9BURK|nr:TetR/AcrR family transcriptional regulator [Pararobbsia silviterrae]RKP46148.1 TetR/AcrR family transcriptional regulator [Pararobbsia silviterrae]
MTQPKAERVAVAAPEDDANGAAHASEAAAPGRAAGVGGPRSAARAAAGIDVPPAPQLGDSAGRTRAYHHGALPAALLAAAETVLARDGLRGLTLRSIAREAGVSHTAPQHHFGDMAGVLSELVARAFERLADRMEASGREAAPGRARRKAVAHAYVEFAIENPDLFRLMSRGELLDSARPSLMAARARAGRVLSGDVDAARDDNRQGTPFLPLTPEHAVAVTSAWAYVHGLATLLIDNRLNGLVRASPAFEDAQALVYRAIETVRLMADD